MSAIMEEIKRDQERKAFEKLVNWIRGDEKNVQQEKETRGFVHPSLELFSGPYSYSTSTDDENNGNSSNYRGIRVATGESISKGTLLVRIPARMTLNGEAYASLKGAENASPWMRCLLALIYAREGTRSGTATCFAKENENGAVHGHVDFKPYLESLPEVFDTLLHWSVDDLTELRGTALYDTIIQSSSGVPHSEIHEQKMIENGMLMACREKFESKTIQGYLNAGVVQGEVTFDEFLYATQCISTRGFNMHNSEELSSYRGPFLIPFIDLLNHCSSSDGRKATTLRRDPRDSSFFLEAEKDLSSEEELLHSYGDLTSHQCLQTFGFVDICRSRSVSSAEANCTPAIMLTSDIVAICKEVAIQAEQLQVPFDKFHGYDEIWDPTECWDKKIKFLEKESIIPANITLPYSENISDELLTCCCILLLPEEAFDEFSQSPALLDESLLDDAFLFAMVQHAILSLVEKKLTRYGDNSESNDVRELSKLIHEQSQGTCAPRFYRKIAALTIKIEEKHCLRCLQNIIVSFKVGGNHCGQIAAGNEDEITQSKMKRAKISHEI